MSYRPICDVWLLARPKVKYYGSFPAGFLHRARALLGCRDADPVLHVCAGRVRDYPYRGMGPHDRTLDLDPDTAPDYLQDARQPLPWVPAHLGAGDGWAGVLIDRPYTADDADKYTPGRGKLPAANALVKAALAVIRPGGRVGILDYVWPQPPRTAREVAVVAVGTGRNARARWFVVFEVDPSAQPETAEPLTDEIAGESVGHV